MAGLRCDFYDGEQVLNKMEMLLFELSGGDPAKADSLRKLPLSMIYNYCYLNRIKDLNLALLQIAKSERGNCE